MFKIHYLTSLFCMYLLPQSFYQWFIVIAIVLDTLWKVLTFFVTRKKICLFFFGAIIVTITAIVLLVVTGRWNELRDKLLHFIDLLCFFTQNWIFFQQPSRSSSSSVISSWRVWSISARSLFSSIDVSSFARLSSARSFQYVAETVSLVSGVSLALKTSILRFDFVFPATLFFRFFCTRCTLLLARASPRFGETGAIVCFLFFSIWQKLC